MHHGVGGGRTQGAKSNKLKWLDELFPGCDVYLQGHTHCFETFVRESPLINRKLGTFSWLRSHYVCTGHFLNWEDSYAPNLKLQPAPKGAALIKLTGNSLGISKFLKQYCHRRKIMTVTNHFHIL
jgi:hypothetical protein